MAERKRPIARKNPSTSRTIAAKKKQASAKKNTSVAESIESETTATATNETESVSTDVANTQVIAEEIQPIATKTANIEKTKQTASKASATKKNVDTQAPETKIVVEEVVQPEVSQNIAETKPPVSAKGNSTNKKTTSTTKATATKKGKSTSLDVELDRKVETTSDVSAITAEKEDSTAKNPLPLSKKMGMFLQDPSLAKLRDNYLFPLDQDYLLATGSSRFTIRDTNEKGETVYSSSDWSKQGDLSFEYFQQNGLIDNPEFHQVNVFSVLSRTLDLVEEEIGHALVWKDGSPLIVRPHAFEGMNAYYDPMNPSLNFGYFTSPFRRTPVWTCLSHDIVAHELGHAILDTFRPFYIYSTDIDTSALHESFSDILAMFSALQYPSVVEHIYRQTGGDMRHPSLLSNLAEEFGVGIFGASIPYLRSALEGEKYSPASPKEPHVRSTVWTAAIYEIMQKLVEIIRPSGFPEFAIALSQVTRWMKGMLIRALHYTPPTSLSMPMLARLIYAADAQVYPNDSKFRDIAKEVFVSRNLWNEKLDLTAPEGIGDVFKKLQNSDSRALNRAIIENAEALRIPPGVSRFLKPRLLTTTRRIDKVKQGKTTTIQEITEHYLEYTYEYSQMVADFLGGMSAFTVYGGGTLVMDANWDVISLATYPEPMEEDPAGKEGGKLAWRRVRQQFDNIHGASIQRTLAAKDENRSLKDLPVIPGCPFVIQSASTGGYRLMRRCCNLHEHIKGISVNKNGLADM
ncbi:hypothetical protein NIES4101_66320 [Calothrix sp. NIES-4101]|nr:hypothetical protein NIES4101_66320 [Calothrix sp. NIES-4101]